MPATVAGLSRHRQWLASMIGSQQEGSTGITLVSQGPVDTDDECHLSHTAWDPRASMASGVDLGRGHPSAPPVRRQSL
jgi:hypothetical protein